MTRLDTDLLRAWLGLPPGPWPPPDRELLGGEATTPALAERRALHLMGRLRPHQLLHPDLVTEGMNRLAQAMLAVAAPPRPTVPSPVPIRPPAPAGGLPATVVVPVPPPAPPSLGTFDLAPTAAPPVRPLAPPRLKPLKPQPVVLDAEVVEDEDDVPIPFARFEQLDAAPIALTTANEPAEFVSVPEVVPPDLPLPPGLSKESRRLVYREVAALRELLRAWASLRTSCGNPSEDFDTPGRIYTLEVGAAQFRAALAHPGLDRAALTPLALRVFAVFRQPTPLAVLRMLSRPQRRLLARDWAVGQSQLAGRELALRNSLRRTRPGGTIAQYSASVGRFFTANPEAVLAILAALLGAITFVKWVNAATTAG